MARAEIRARATLDNSQFKVGVAQMNQGVQRFAGGQIKQMAGLIGGAFAVGAVIAFTKEMFNAADAIDNTAKQLNVGVEELQALQRETELTAGSAEKMTGALLKLSKAQANAVGGEISQVDAFKDLGISMDDVRSKNPTELFEMIAQKVTRAGAVSQEASGASLILGRSYVELNEVMRKVADEGLANMRDGMLENNQIMSEATVFAADAMEEAFNKSIKSMTNSLRTFFVEAKTAWFEFAAYLGALSGGASEQEASMIAFQQEDPLFQSQKAKAEREGKQIASAGGGATTAAKAIPIAQATDQIAKIGGILGAQGISNTERLARDQVDQLRMTNEKLDRIADASKKTSENTEPLKED